MPRWVQVIGWLVILFLFVILVLYPLLGINYFQGTVIEMTRDQNSGQRKNVRVAKLRVHQSSGGISFTNDDGEFTIAVRGPILPSTGTDFSVGDPTAEQDFTLPAPWPFISLFNPNLRKIFRVPLGDGLHYYLDQKEAESTLQRKPSELKSQNRNRSTFGGIFSPRAVLAAAPPAEPGFTMHVNLLQIENIPASDIYFRIRVNGSETHIDSVPDATSPSSKRLSVDAKPIVLDDFDIPIGSQRAQVEIGVLTKRLFGEQQLGLASLVVEPASPSQVGELKTIRQANFLIRYEILPPVALGCSGINRKNNGMIGLSFWLDNPSQFRNTVTAVQYDLGPTYNPSLVSFPTVDKANSWTYSIAGYSPQVVRATVTFQDGTSLDLNTFCKVGRSSESATAYYAQARSYYFDEQFDQAIQSANKAIQLAGGSFNPALSVRASALAGLGKFPDALQAYKIAISNDRSALMLNSYAWFLVNYLPNPTKEQLLEAARVATEATDKEPNGARFDTLGWAEYKLGDFKSALRALETGRAFLERSGLTTNGNWQTIQYHLGFTLLKLQQPSAAQRAFQEVLAFANKYKNSNPEYVNEAEKQLASLNKANP